MKIRSRARSRPEPAPEHAKLLDTLVREQGVGPHVIFFLDGEGELLTNGAEASSGYVLDRLGRVYAFWVGWDAEHESAMFSLWEQVDSDPAWLENATPATGPTTSRSDIAFRRKSHRSRRSRSVSVPPLGMRRAMNSAPARSGPLRDPASTGPRLRRRTCPPA